MTLVLGCLTKDYAIQVSDRRTIDLDGNIVDNDRNKAVAFDGRYAFAYSGLAELEGMPTDVWLTRELAIAPYDDPFGSVANAAVDVMRNPRIPVSLKRFAFIGVGWKSEPGVEGFVPAFTIITNSVRQDGSWGTATDEFGIWDHILTGDDSPDELTVTTPIGAPVTESEMWILNRGLKEVVQRQVGPFAAARLMERTIRSVASRDGSVGREFLVMIVPRPISHKHESVFFPIPGVRPPLTSIGCYLVSDRLEDLKWIVPNYAKDGWGITDINFDYQGPSEMFVSCCYRAARKGRGMIGMSGGDVSVFTELTSDGIPQMRISRSGYPDQVLKREDLRIKK